MCIGIKEIFMSTKKLVSGDDFLELLDKSVVIKTEDINNLEEKEEKLLNLENENQKQKKIIEEKNTEINKYLEKIRLLEEKLQNNNKPSDDLPVEIKAIAQKYNDLMQEHEEMKIRVKRDIRKIGLKEKELSNRIEIMKQDHHALLKTKDNQLLQLKKQIDDKEYELETSRDKMSSMLKSNNRTDEQLENILRSLKLSISVLEGNATKDK